MAHHPIYMEAFKPHIVSLSRKQTGSYVCRLVGGAMDRAGRLGVVVHSAAPARPTWMTVKPADSRESPFRELDLMELWDGIGKTRVRQHVNPLRREFQQPTAAPDWSAVFSDPSLPLALDIGSGYGRFLLLLQRNNPDQQVNYLGLEIRRTLVDRSNEWVSRLGLQGRVHYLFSNATVSLTTLLGSYPGPITDVFIQFPDPHFKRRHHKRRVVQPQLVTALRDLMPRGGRLLLQSDVEEACVAMVNMFEKYAGEDFTLAPQHSQCAVFFSRRGTEQQQQQQQQQQQLQGQAIRDGGEATKSTTAPATVHRAAATQARDVDTHGCAAAAAAAGDQTAPAAGVRQTEVGVVLADTDDGDMAAGEEGSVSGDDDIMGVDGDSDEEDILNMVSEWAKGGWLVDNPVGTPTEREHYVAQQGLPVYRVMLTRV